MKPKEKNIITDWLKENGNPEVEVQVLNEVVDKLVEERDTLLKQRDDYAIEFAKWIVKNCNHSKLKFLDYKELLEIFKKEKGWI